MLLALLAVAVPIILHLLQRRRPRRVRFAAIEFILRSQRRTARRFRLRQLLLLLARCAIVAAIVMAIARPQWLSEAPSLASVGPPTATVVVLDDSLSMRLRDDGAPLFERALRHTLEVFEAQRGQDAGGLVLAGAPPRALTPGLSFDRRELLALLAGREASYRATDLPGAIGRALELLGETALPVKRVVVISDFARAGFEPARLPWGPQEEPPAEVVLVPVRPEQTAVNRAVVGVRVKRAEAEGPLAYALRATVRVLGRSPGQPGEDPAEPPDSSGPMVHLEVDGERVSTSTLPGAADVEGGASKQLLHRFGEPGLHHGAFVLEADALPEDDRRPFAVHVAPPIRVLAVNGDPRTPPPEDELFHLEAALAPGPTGGGRVRATLVGVPLLQGVDLARFDLVVLANVAGLSPELVGRLRDYVLAGGGLLLSAGDNVDPDRYNRELGALLPRAVRGLRQSTGSGGQGPGEGLGPLKAGAPFLATLLGTGGEGLRAARFWGYLVLEPGGGQPVQVHLSTESGAPLLVEGRMGRGRVALLTTTLDRDWSDLPLRTGFLPLLQELCLHLAGAQEASEQPVVTVGSPLALPLPPGTERATLLTPGRPPQSFASEQLKGRATLRVDVAEVPGLHRLRTFDQDQALLTEELRVVVCDPSESDPTPLGPAELRALGSKPPSPTDDGQGPTLRPHKMWPWVLLVLVLLLAGEAALLLRRDQLSPDLSQQ